MSFAYSLQAISPAATANTPHILGFATARGTAGDLLLDVWNGPTNAARVASLNREGVFALPAAGKVTLGGKAVATYDAANAIMRLGGGEGGVRTAIQYIPVQGDADVVLAARQGQMFIAGDTSRIFFYTATGRFFVQGTAI